LHVLIRKIGYPLAERSQILMETFGGSIVKVDEHKALPKLCGHRAQATFGAVKVQKLIGVWNAH